MSYTLPLRVASILSEEEKRRSSARPAMPPMTEDVEVSVFSRAPSPVPAPTDLPVAEMGQPPRLTARRIPSDPPLTVAPTVEPESADSLPPGFARAPQPITPPTRIPGVAPETAGAPPVAPADLPVSAPAGVMRTLPRKGVGGRFKDALATMMRGFAQPIQPTGDGRYDFFQRLGGGAGGFGLGLIDPDVHHRLLFQENLAREDERKLKEAELATVGQRARHTEAQIANLKADNDRADEQLRLLDEDRRSQIENREAAAEARRQGNEDRAYNNWLMHGDPKRPITKEEAQRMGRPELVGSTPPPRRPTASERPRYTYYNKTLNGKVYRAQVDEDTGQERILGETNQSLAKDPNEMTDSERRQQLNSFNSFVGDAQKLMSGFETAKRRASEADAKARRLHNAFEAQKGDRNIAAQDRIAQDEVDAAWQRLEAARAEMQGVATQLQAFSDIVRVSPDGTAVELRMDEVNRRRSEFSGPRPSAAMSPAGLKAGDTVTIGGKQLRVTMVYPDGTFDAQ